MQLVVAATQWHHWRVQQSSAACAVKDSRDRWRSDSAPSVASRVRFLVLPSRCLAFSPQNKTPCYTCCLGMGFFLQVKVVLRKTFLQYCLHLCRKPKPQLRSTFPHRYFILGIRFLFLSSRSLWNPSVLLWSLYL